MGDKDRVGQEKHLVHSTGLLSLMAKCSTPDQEQSWQKEFGERMWLTSRKTKSNEEELG